MEYDKLEYTKPEIKRLVAEKDTKQAALSAYFAQARAAAYVRTLQAKLSLRGYLLMTTALCPVSRY